MFSFHFLHASKLKNALFRYYSSDYKFVDKVVLDVAGGKGGEIGSLCIIESILYINFALCGTGNGCIAWLELTPGSKRANGGSGGRGGDVYIVADKNVRTLIFFGLIFPF